MKNTLSIFAIALVLLMVPFSKSQAQIEGKKVLFGISGQGFFPKRSGGFYSRSILINSSLGYFVGRRVVLGSNLLFQHAVSGTYGRANNTRSRSIFLGFIPFIRVFVLNTTSKINFYLEPSAGLFTRGDKNEDNSSVRTADFDGNIISINPGLVYFLSKNAALDLRYSFGRIRYSAEGFSDEVFRNVTLGINFYF